MTRIYKGNRTCSVCGTTSEHAIFQSSNQHGADLDTRPGEMMRSTMYVWIQPCPSCGYCAPDISMEIAQAKQIIGSTKYGEQVKNESYPELANHFLCWAIIQEETGNYPEAGWGALHAAWACDDAGMNNSAHACRLRAIQLFQQAKKRKMPFAQDAGVEEAILADLLRRTGQFGLVKKVCSEGLGKKPNARVKQMLNFQIVLAVRHDEKCYTVDDAQKYAKGQ